MAAALIAAIDDRIARSGPMTVAEFIGLALYHEELGYYARAGQRSGRAGDFITSVDLGPVFGELLAAQFADMRPLAGGPGFDLVEAAAGNGRLARDILDAAAASHPDLYAATRVHLVERSPAARAAHAATLGPHAARLAFSGPDLPARVTGAIYANELLDALPPHLVVMRDAGLREVYVGSEGGRLVTREGDLSSPAIARHLDRVGARLEPGWSAEVNLAAADWVRRAGACLDRGFLLLIDYGMEASALYSAAHAGGTLTTYRRHAAETREQGPGWLLEPGDRDITSHVDLTAVKLAAADAGLTLVGIVDQTYFLLGLAGRLLEGGSAFPDDPKRRLALKTLLMPGGLGSTLKVLLFSKGVDAARLQGLSFGGRLT